jgi:hypothetical protein
LKLAKIGINVFFSAGGPSSDGQKLFISRLKEVIEAENLIPATTPFADRIEDTINKIEETMDQCSGAIILAFERVYVEKGQEFRSGNLPNRTPKLLEDVKLTTVWNQIEAAMAELRKLPLLIIFENGLRIDGFLEHNTWRPLAVTLDPALLSKDEFRQRLLYWKSRVEEFHRNKSRILANRRTLIRPRIALAVGLGAFAIGVLAGGLLGYREATRIFVDPG